LERQLLVLAGAAGAKANKAALMTMRSTMLVLETLGAPPATRLAVSTVPGLDPYVRQPLALPGDNRIVPIALFCIVPI